MSPVSALSLKYSVIIPKWRTSGNYMHKVHKSNLQIMHRTADRGGYNICISYPLAYLKYSNEYAKGYLITYLCVCVCIIFHHGLPCVVHVLKTWLMDFAHIISGCASLRNDYGILQTHDSEIISLENVLIVSPRNKLTKVYPAYMVNK